MWLKGWLQDLLALASAVVRTWWWSPNHLSEYIDVTLAASGSDYYDEVQTMPAPPPDHPVTLEEVAQRIADLSDIVTVKADAMTLAVANATRLVASASAHVTTMGEYLRTVNAAKEALLDQIQSLEQVLVTRNEVVDGQLKTLQRLVADLPCSPKKRNGNASGCPVER